MPGGVVAGREDIMLFDITGDGNMIASDVCRTRERSTPPRCQRRRESLRSGESGPDANPDGR
ncbi:MAG: hypothetical protein CM1200mP2_29300 [Planctomycetaceae bacterium]|nr:MAG: hypothetical protein CM1200mP2_29300 [Planctomycetaceae bacterium]